MLFEKILRERKVEQVQRQRLLMPLLVELLPEQMVTFAAIADELERNGFEAEPFGPRTLAVKATPVGLEGKELERVLEELLGETEKTAQVDNEETAADAHCGVDCLPCGDQGEYAAGAGEDRLAFGGVGQDRASDELSAWAPHRIAVFSKRHTAGVSAHLATSSPAVCIP